MCEKAIEKELRELYHVPDHFNTQKMCNILVACNPYTLDYVPDQYKTHEMCDKAVPMDPDVLKGVPNLFKT